MPGHSSLPGSGSIAVIEAWHDRTDHASLLESGLSARSVEQADCVLHLAFKQAMHRGGHRPESIGTRDRTALSFLIKLIPRVAQTRFATEETGHDKRVGVIVVERSV